MIHLERHGPPKLWDSPKFQKFLEEWSRFHGEGGTRAKQRRSPQGELERFQEQALGPLLDAFSGKCAYTEQTITAEDAVVVFHRPATDAVGLQSEISPEHYWWGVGDWANWYPASRALSLAKSTVFPVAGERSPVPPATEMPSEAWRSENLDRGLLLDPGRDHPAWFLEFRPDGSVGPREHPSPDARSWAEGHSRGEITIQSLDLDNRRLREGRMTAMAEAGHAMMALLGTGTPRRKAAKTSRTPDSSSAIDSRTEYAGAARQAAARALLETLASLEQPKDHQASIARLIEELAEELAAEIAHHGVPWAANSPPAPMQRWVPVREVIGREWPELNDADLRRMVGGGTGDGRPKGTPRMRVGGTGDGRAKVTPHVSFGTPDGGPASEQVDERVVQHGAQIDTVKIRNFKAIEEFVVHTSERTLRELQLSTRGVQIAPSYGTSEEPLDAVGWTVFLGENGSGKSCVLQALGLALAGDQLDRLITDCELEWRKLLRRGAKQGRVLIRFTGGATADLRFNAKRHWWMGGAPRMATFVRGYGATRLLEGEAPTTGTGDGSYVRLANLFDPKAPVIDAERWLLELEDEGDFHVAAVTLGGFLGAEDAVRADLIGEPAPPPLLTREHGEVLVGGDPLSYASDGYRAIVAMVCDVMAGLGVGLSDMRNATGIVLLDEIGAHLHPRWKMEITGRLRREFPRLQFLVSTHEPLCLRGLFKEEVLRVRKIRPPRPPGEPPAPGRVRLELVERSPGDFRVDQLLTSEFFGLDTTIDPDLDRRFQTYYQLLAMPLEERRARTLPNSDPPRSLEDELTRLGAKLEDLTRPVLGFTRRDQLVYEAIDRFLTDDVLEKRAGSTPKQRHQRRLAILDEIEDIWKPPDFKRRSRGR